MNTSDIRPLMIYYAFWVIMGTLKMSGVTNGAIVLGLRLSRQHLAL